MGLRSKSKFEVIKSCKNVGYQGHQMSTRSKVRDKGRKRSNLRHGYYHCDIRIEKDEDKIRNSK